MDKKNYIRVIRELRGLSQAALAEKMGISQSQVDRIEKGQRKLTVDWVLKFSEALDTTFGSILEGPGPAPSKEISPETPEGIDVHATVPSMSSINFFMLESSRYKVPVPRGIQLLERKGKIKSFEMCNGSLNERYIKGDFIFYSIEKNYINSNFDLLLKDYYRCPFLVFVSDNECFAARFIGFEKNKLNFSAEMPSGERDCIHIDPFKILSMHRIFEWEEVIYGVRRITMYQKFDDAIKDFNAK